jgi:hypothetical protein
MERNLLPCTNQKHLFALVILLLLFSFSFAQTSIFQPDDVPASPHNNDGEPIELGVKFRTTQNGYITGIRYYKSAGITGTRTAHLWSNTGTLLAEALFTSETASGWQEILFTAPVAITAGTTYVASYFSSSGHYGFTNPFFTQAVVNGPLRALANGEDGPNGLYKYSSTGVFPTDNFQSMNYWVDVVFTVNNGPDITPPAILSVSPVNGGTDVNLTTSVSAVFNEAINASTVNGSTFFLKDGANSTIAATLQTTSNKVTLTPSAPLLHSVVYTATIRGGNTGIKDLAGNALMNDYSWTFTAAVPLPDPQNGPGGPILVVSSSANPFSRFAAEILRAEGLNAFAAEDITALTQDILGKYDVVILGEMPLTAAQTTLFTNWVNAGGTLIAFRPDTQLSSLLGITKESGKLADKYLLVNTSSGPGTGIVNQTIQYHGIADQYTLNSATRLATLYADATTSTIYPAITSRNVGVNGGKAIAFAFDLARSIVYTRQGNPAWAGQERDGIGPIRTDDLFFGNATGDPQPNWIDFNKVAIPQADEQQRLLANIILQGNLHRKPLPRFWYLPKGLKAAIVMTGDDHANNGTAGRFNKYLTQGPNSPEDVLNWNAVRGTSYIYPNTSMTNAQAKTYEEQGFEIALHPHVNPGGDCANYTPATLENAFTTQLAQLHAQLPGIAAPVSNRNHCLVWSDWSSTPKIQAKKGIRLDVNYYNWPESWMQNIPGMFTGSGMPMRFADLDGSLIDCYQVTTQLTDETNMNYTAFTNALLNKALGPEGYYGVFCANMHTDAVLSDGSDQIVAAAQSHQVPVVSAKQMLDWLDGRNSSFFGAINWNGNQLAFTITAKNNARNLKAMLPVNVIDGELISISRNGSIIPFVTETIKGMAYAFFDAPAGTHNYVASYNVSNAGPVITLQPVPATVCEGKSVLFHSEATGNPAPGVQWQESVDGVNWTNITGATSTQLLFTPVVGDNNKKYRAVWKNSLGTTISNAVILTVNPLPALSGSLSQTANSGVVFTYTPASNTTTNTLFEWSRASVAGISNPASSGSGSISETLINTTSAPVNVTYVYRLTANGCIRTQLLVVTVKPQAAACEMNIAITSAFNSSSIPAGRYIWFNSVMDPGNLGSNGAVNFYVTDAKITFTANRQQYTLTVPNSHIYFGTDISTPVTQYLGTGWKTAVPLNTSGNVFFGGLAYQVPVSLPGSISNVVWSAKVSSDKPGVSFSWNWAAAVYTNFAGNAGLNIKPTDGLQVLTINLTDKAGTPLNYKPYVVSGATGGGILSVGLINIGLFNYTGNYSSTGSASCTMFTQQTGGVLGEVTGGSLSTEQRTEPAIETRAFGIKVMPNPASAYFNLAISSDREGGVTVRIADINGRIIERYENVMVGTILRLGEKWKQGTYIAEVFQGNQRKIMKLVKIN